MKPAQILKQKINSGQLTLGAIATFHLWHGAVELALRCGLDYLIIDLEHLEHPAEAIARHPLVTAMAIGPYDLSADLGLC